MTELGRLQFDVPDQRGTVEPHTLIREKEEHLVLVNRPAQAAAKFPVFLVIAGGTVTRDNGKRTGLACNRGEGYIVRSVKLIECVEPLVIELNDSTSVKIVRAIFRDDLHLSA